MSIVTVQRTACALALNCNKINSFFAIYSSSPKRSSPNNGTPRAARSDTPRACPTAVGARNALGSKKIKHADNAPPAAVAAGGRGALDAGDVRGCEEVRVL